MERAEAAFVVKFPERSFEAAFSDGVAGVSDDLMPAVLSFEENLRAIVRILTLPYQLSGAAVQQHRIDQLYRAEVIRSLDLNDPSRDDSPDTRAAARTKALAAFKAELDTEQALMAFREQAIADLSTRLHLPEVTTAAADLLRQAASMTWTTLEVLFRDLVTAILNGHPSLVSLILQDERARRILDLKRIDTEVLVSHGFDLRGKVGTIIASHNAFARLDTVRVVFGALCPSEVAVARMLDDRQLWLLVQQRHLIVHRRGIVDVQYVENGGDARPLGSLLTLTPPEVVEQLILAQRVGLGIARGFSALVQQTHGQASTAQGEPEP